MGSEFNELHANSYFQQLNKSKKIGLEIVSNLELQMALYFNVVFFPFWVISITYMLYLKFDSIHNLYQVITSLVLIILIPMEAFRLYLGYVGNLLEKIPELAGFWMLSLLLQTPLQAFLLLSEAISSQIAERAIQSVMCIMLVVELVFGFHALRQISRFRANKFHLTQMHSSDGQYNSSQTSLEHSSVKSE